MKRLREILFEMDIEGAKEKAQKLTAYMDAIIRANEDVNLTAITDREEFINKHLIDSLGCAQLDEFVRAGSIIDVGTGGGFPGVPLAIAFPEKQFTLLDSLNKRIRIIDETARDLGIHNIRALHGRAEDLAKDLELRETFDLCVSRAVANMRTLAELCLPFVALGGSFVAFKGPGCEAEVDDAAKAIRLLGGELDRIWDQPAADGMEGHRLVVIRKTSATEDRFPRRAGRPSRDPL